MALSQYFAILFDFENSRYSFRIEIFFKGWYLIVLFKLLLLGSLFQEQIMFQFSPYGNDILSGLLLKLLFGALLLMGVFLKRNYFLSFLLFLITFGVHQITHQIINGGDLVILFFMFLGIFCNTRPRLNKNWLANGFQVAIINFSILIGKIQIALIYLHSGWDKLISPGWRDGTALFNLLHIDFYATNWVDQLTDDVGTSVLVIISWLVILMELLFPVLVWFPRFRYYVLATGALFHLLIGYGLSLPDFAMVMIWTYILFIPDVDFDKLILKMKGIAR